MNNSKLIASCNAKIKDIEQQGLSHRVRLIDLEGETKRVNNDLAACSGAIQMLKVLIAELEADKSENTPTTQPAPSTT